jgi:hypothetical protein
MISSVVFMDRLGTMVCSCLRAVSRMLFNLFSARFSTFPPSMNSAARAVRNERHAEGRHSEGRRRETSCGTADSFGTDGR